MLSNFLIGLREGMEASLIVGILYAYLVKSDRRAHLPALWTGVGIAAAISFLFGAILTFGPRGLTFEAQEVIGGVLSIIAVGFITWMIFWMAKSARSIKGHLEGQLGGAVEKGAKAIAVVAALAVGREGLETALFVWAGTSAAGETATPLIGALLGLAVAIVLGVLIYRGAVRIDLAKFFAVTGGFLIVVAAGVLAYGMHDLQEAGVLPGLNSLAFDVSKQVPPSGWLGTILKGTFNFSPATTWLEAIAWVTYMTIVLPLFVRMIRPKPASNSSGVTAGSASAGSAGTGSAGTGSADAGFVSSPSTIIGSPS